MHRCACACGRDRGETAQLLRMQIHLVTGGAGFLGSHLIDRLMEAGDEVICLDNYFTGRKANIARWIGHPRFELIRHDVTEPIKLEVDRIWHLACPASPIHYQFNPVKTAKTSFLGTYNMLGLARRVGARLLLASTSEVYGDPEVHPQPESYWGSVNPIGVRSCYDEGNMNDLDIRIARIFNTYGPRMAIDDGRVISNFFAQALRSNSLTIYGSGAQTRSFCYVSDLITGLIALMDSSYDKPVNIGNPSELSINDIAETIRSMVNPDIKFSYRPLPEDDPVRRCPSIELAQKYLKWLPQVSIQKGLQLTLDYYQKTLLT